MGAMKQKMLEDMERGGFESWRELAEWLDKSSILDADIAGYGREVRFVRNMVKLTTRGGTMSPKQQAWLQDIYERRQEEGDFYEALTKPD